MTSQSEPPLQLDHGLWNNWAGTVTTRPRYFEQPRNEAEIVAAVRRAAEQGQRIRVVGSGHSFNGVAATNETLLNLDLDQGIESIDRKRDLVTVRGGTRLYHLSRLLQDQGYAQENMGDINRQSIAGAISTGTHGTGLGLGGLSTQVVGLRLVDGQGRVRMVGTSDPHQLAAARLSLGALGIISAVTLRVIPAYRLRMDIASASLNEMFALAPEYARQNRHFEFYWLSYTERVQVKRTNVTTDPVTEAGALTYFNDTILENTVVKGLCETVKAFPQTTSTVSRILAAGITANTRVRDSWNVFASQRHVRFNEMEYAVPLDATLPVVRDLRAMLNRLQLPVVLPVEVRFVRGDDLMLSTATGRDSGYVAVHMYQGMEYERYFREAEAIFRAYDGRPHWGKWHHLAAADLSRLYPRFEDFRAVRQEFDPERRFGNPYLRRVLGD